MVGTLYFDISGRYTSGDDALDTFVADLVDSQTNASMTREEMLRAVYEYVRDHYLYLKRSLYEVGETGWEIPEALLMFQSGKGNCYNFTAAFWSLAAAASGLTRCATAVSSASDATRTAGWRSHSTASRMCSMWRPKCPTVL